MQTETLARVLGHHVRPDGNSDTFWGRTVPCRVKPLQRPNKTATPYQILFNGRWHRVRQARVAGQLVRFVGRRPSAVGEQIRVDYLPEA